MSKNDISNNSEELRPNYKIISSSTEPVYTTSGSANNPTMPIVIQTCAETYAKLGKRFSFNTGAQALSSSGYLAMQFTIPSGWGKTMYMDRIRVGTSDSSVVDCMPGAMSTAATLLSATNSYLGNTNPTAVTAAYAVASTILFTSSSTPIQTCILSGATQEINYDGRYLAAGGTTAQSFVVRVFNSGGNGGRGMVNFSWWEV